MLLELDTSGENIDIEYSFCVGKSEGGRFRGHGHGKVDDGDGAGAGGTASRARPACPDPAAMTCRQARLSSQGTRSDPVAGGGVAPETPMASPRIERQEASTLPGADAVPRPFDRALQLWATKGLANLEEQVPHSVRTSAVVQAPADGAYLRQIA
ncbi:MULTISPECIES: hypothetical protein [unclassified Streptomyces]|uniref:hypothetical protein n=1 Tax=unclassified Streptomyces TaxID=2593676 RepID=UPI0033F953F0